jgi:hypothetical protein
MGGQHGGTWHCAAEETGGTLCVTSTFDAHFGKQPPSTWISSGLDDAISAGGGLGYVVGTECSQSRCSGLIGTSTDGAVPSTSDGGLDWAKTSLPDWAYGMATAGFADRSSGWVIATDDPGGPAVLESSSDGAKKCYGDGTTLWHTTDGGRDWAPLQGLLGPSEGHPKSPITGRLNTEVLMAPVSPRNTRFASETKESSTSRNQAVPRPR